jgi:quercetin dioxygenase-like cupin family protein
MNKIHTLPMVYHSGLPGVSVLPLSGRARAGQPQEVLVVVEPNARIPLHRHTTHATMVIVAGSAEVLSESRELDGVPVERGSVVEFEADVAHGFQASACGLTFISKNGGIVDADEKHWDIAFSA